MKKKNDKELNRKELEFMILELKEQDRDLEMRLKGLKEKLLIEKKNNSNLEKEFKTTCMIGLFSKK